MRLGFLSLVLSFAHANAFSGTLPLTCKYDYPSSSAGVKAVVGGLTGFFNALGAGESSAASPKGEKPKQPRLTPTQVKSGIQEDYNRAYLWTGDITEGLYDEDCSFRDPTISFDGLETFKRNVSNLQWLVERLVHPYGVDLLECELDTNQSCVRTRWRMYGKLLLPWKPVINVIGRTRFTYDASRGNRVVDYDEEWEMPATEALLQIVRPGGDILP